MLEIINKLAPFFEDCYAEYGVREYAKKTGMSPPTASKVLREWEKEGLFVSRRERQYLLFSLDGQSKDVVDLSRMYWRRKLEGFLNEVDKNLANPVIILFGSLAKAEVTPDSDVDVVVIGSQKPIDVGKYERKVKRTISIHWFSSLKEIKNEHLLNNVLNGYVLRGRMKW